MKEKKQLRTIMAVVVNIILTLIAIGAFRAPTVLWIPIVGIIFYSFLVFSHIVTITEQEDKEDEDSMLRFNPIALAISGCIANVAILFSNLFLLIYIWVAILAIVASLVITTIMVLFADSIIDLLKSLTKKLVKRYPGSIKQVKS